MWAKNAEFVLGKFPFINFKIKTNFILYRGQSFYCRGHVTSKFVHGKCPFIIFKMKIYKRKKCGSKMLNLTRQIPFYNF